MQSIHSPIPTHQARLPCRSPLVCIQNSSSVISAEPYIILGIALSVPVILGLMLPFLLSWFLLRHKRGLPPYPTSIVRRYLRNDGHSRFKNGLSHVPLDSMPNRSTTSMNVPASNTSANNSSHHEQSDHHQKGSECYSSKVEIETTFTSKRYHLPDTFAGVVEFTILPSGSVYHSVDHGVTMVIPEGAVLSPTKMWLAAALYGPFVFPSGHVPVSPIVWLQSDVPLLKPAMLRMPHCLTVANEQERQKLMFLTGDDILEDNLHPSVSLRPDSRQGTFTPRSSYASIEIKHFCFECITCISQSLLEHCRYCITEVLHDMYLSSQWKVEYCVTYSLPTCLKVRISIQR